MISASITVLLISTLFVWNTVTDAFVMIRPVPSISFVEATSNIRILQPTSGWVQQPSTTDNTFLRANAKDEEAPMEDTSVDDSDVSTNNNNNMDKDKEQNTADDILNSLGFLKRKLEVLQSDLELAQKDLTEAEERLAAGKVEWGKQIEALDVEFNNIRDRMNTQSNKSDNQATMQVARQMLGVLDNFDRAFQSVTPQTDADRMIEADYQQAYNDILAVFEKLGIEKVETVGNEFDYQFHQAVMQKASEEYEEGIVCEELAKGFKIGDTLIRAAMVVVAA